MKNDKKNKAITLVEALPYIKQFSGQIMVIKYGGSLMVNEKLRETFANDVVLLRYVGIKPVIVHGGGKEMLQKIYDKILPGKIHVLGCGPYGKEALVSKVPINGVADLKGVKIRSPEGLAADVFRRAGASPSSLPFSEVYTSLEKGIVDAADASVYINNHASGFHKIAKYPLYPGIHSMANLQTIINKKVFNKLSKQNQTALTIWTYWTWTAKLRDAGLEGRAQVAKDKAAGDLTIIDWPVTERAKFRKIAVDAWNSAASKSPLAKEALESNLAYMKKIGLL